MQKWRWDQIIDVLRDANPRRGVELGVKHGTFTFELLRAFPDLKMIAVDLWMRRPPKDVPGEHYDTYHDWDFAGILSYFTEEGDRRYPGRITILRMDTADAAANFDNESIDFAFIDADHTYAAVRRDIEAWLPKIRKGGILCGHDYASAKHIGVKRAVDQIFGDRVMTGIDMTWWSSI